MDSAIGSIGLPVALAIVMFGLGLSLTVDDFRRIAREPKAVTIALGAQRLILPALCFGLILLFDPAPAIAVGMMLLAASPGGTSANLGDYLAAVGSLAAVFCVVSLTVGYVIPRLAKIDRKKALATAFEVGVHNGTLAITVAISVLGDKQLAVPAAIYSVLMGPIATLAGFILTSGDRKASLEPTPAKRSESFT